MSDARPSPSPDVPRPAPSGPAGRARATRRPSWLAWLGLAICLVLTFTLWSAVRRTEQRRLQDRFNITVTAIQARIANRMASHEQILLGAAEYLRRERGLPTRDDWRQYAAALKLDQFDPGVQALGFAEWIPLADLDAHLRRMRAAGPADYAVQPGGPLPPEGGVSSILFLEPFDARNQRAFGRDMYAEPVRRAAMALARDTGQATITGRLTLYQEDSLQVQAGTLLYVPVYRRGQPLATVAQRRAALRGWSYMAFRMQDLMAGILGGAAQGLQLRVHDGEAQGPGDLLYDGALEPGAASGTPAWSRRVAFQVAGRTWILHAAALPESGASFGAGNPFLVLALGLLGSLALFGLLASLARGEQAARSMADERLERLQLLLNSVGEAIYGVDLEGRCTFCNPACLRLTGYADPGQLLGRNMHELIHHSYPDGRPFPAEECRILLAIQEGREVHVDQEVLWRADGTCFPAEYRSYPQRRDGRIVGAVVTFTDITERRQAEAVLRESEARMRAVTDSAQDAIFIMDGDGRLTYWNPAAARTLGYAPDEVLGRNLHDLITPLRHLEAHRAGFARFRDSGAGPAVGTTRLLEVLHRDGHEIPVEVSISAFHFQDSWHSVGILRDITARRQAEEDRRRLDAKLLEVQKLESLAGLVAGVAHNLNNVLAVAMGTASLRAQAAPGPEDLEAYRTIDRVCQRGREVVKSLIHFSQPTPSGRAPCRLDTLVEEVGLLFRDGGNPLAVLVTSPPEAAWIEGDAGHLRQALVNLCLNAMEAMPAGGTLRLGTAAPAPDLVEVRVADDGAGMPPEVLARSLEPFYTTKAVGHGPGLGLSMAYGVVKAHGGSLDIASQPGLGTTITLQFPRIPAPVLEPRGPAGPPAPLSVFLVDDDEDVRFLMARMLRKAGAAEVRSFAGGQAVLAALAAEALPDLVILDQNMPGLDGAQTLERIRGLHPALPVLISSGQPSVEDWDCFRRPGVAVIPKPFTMGEIQEKLAGFGSLR